MKKFKKIMKFIVVIFFVTLMALMTILIVNNNLDLNDLVLIMSSLVAISLNVVIFWLSQKNDMSQSKHEYRNYLIDELKLNEHYDINKVSLDESEKESEKENDNKNSEQINENCDGTLINEQKNNYKKDIIALMLKNNDEITDYFKISKSQARSSFGLSVAFCILGIVPLGAGIYCMVVLKDISVSIISLISGSISEFVSGTIFWLHNKSALQLNHYYDALHENEKFLSAVNIADKLSDEKREEILVEIIHKQISYTPKKIETENKKEKES